MTPTEDPGFKVLRAIMVLLAMIIVGLACYHKGYSDAPRMALVTVNPTPTPPPPTPEPRGRRIGDPEWEAANVGR